MASRLKSVGLVMILGCAVTATFIQRWHPGGEYSPRMSALRIAIRDSTRALSDANRLYTDYIVTDSLLPLIPANAGIYINMSPLASDSASALRRLVDDQLRGVSQVKARIALFVVPTNFGLHGRARPRDGTPRDMTYYTGVDASGPYCAVIIRLKGLPNPAGKFATNIRYTTVRLDYNYYSHKTEVLGPCLFWAKHGAPGPEIDKWLRAGAYRFAQGPANSLREVGWDTPLPFDNGYYGSGSISGEKCRAGQPDACVTAATHFGARPGANRIAAYDGRVSYDDYYFGPFGQGDEALLAFIDNRFGGAKFDTFWRSKESPEGAFQTAFGVPMGSWLEQWSQKYYGVVKPSPRMSPLTILFSIVTLLFFMYVAIRFAQDRQVNK